MLTYGGLMRLDTGAIRTVGTTLSEHGNVVDSAADHLQAKRKGLPKIWDGRDAEAVAAHLDRQVKPMEDSGQVYRMASRILTALATELDAIRKRAATTAGEVPVKVPGDVDDETGVVTARLHPPLPPGASQESHNKRDLANAARTASAAAYTAVLQNYVKQANEADTDAQRALGKIDTLSEVGNAYQGEFGEDADTEDAKRAKDLLDKLDKGDLLSDVEKKEIKALLAQNKFDPQFAGTLLKSLGPEGFLKAHGNLALRGILDKNSQYDLGHILSTGNDWQNPHHVDSAWGTQLKALIAKDIQLATGVPLNGGTLLAPLLQSGDYHKNFLVPLAEEIYKHFPADKPGLPVSPAAYTILKKLNPGGDYGSHPLNDVLLGLSNNPESAAAFFANNKDNRIKLIVENANRSYSGLGQIKTESIGRALEAATTNVDFNDSYASRPPHTLNNRDVAGALFELIGKQPTLLEGDTAKLDSIRDNLTNITAEYLPDINRLLTEPDGVKYLPRSRGEELTISTDNTALRKYLATVGQDPDAYAKLTLVSKGILLASIYGLEAGDKRRRAAANADARLRGLLDAAQRYAIITDQAEKDEAQNKLVEYGQTGVSTIVGLGTSLIVSPIGGAIAGAVADTTIAAIFDGLKADNAAQAATDAESWRDSHNRSALTSLAALINGEDELDISDWAATKYDLSYNDTVRLLDKP